MSGILAGVSFDHWSSILNLLAHQYFVDSHATCFLWHSKFAVHLEVAMPVLMLEPETWSVSDTLKADIYDYEKKRTEFHSRFIEYDDWILKLTVAIEQTNCESFIVFQEHIPLFAQSFYYSSKYSIWSSQKNRFIFAYTTELLEGIKPENYFNGYIFHDQPNILLLYAQTLNSSVFEIQTNRFVGPRSFVERQAPQFDVLQQYYVTEATETGNTTLSLNINKLQNLQGREMIIGVFDYKPFMLVDYTLRPTVYDRAEQKEKPEVYIDGTEVRMMFIYCELHNCTVQADTSETDWGDTYSNGTGHGLVGLVLNRRSDYGIGAMFYWYGAYQNLAFTSFLGRSGVTCLVPAPHRLIYWTLPLAPFQPTLWLCVVVCLLLESIALCCIRRCEQELQLKVQGWSHSMHFACASVFKLIVNQGTNYASSSYSLRVLLLACYIIDIIVTTVYGGGLAAILTLPSLEEAADSRERLYKHKLPWVATSNAWITPIDSQGNDPIIIGLLNKFRVLDADQITLYSQTESMAFVVERLQYGHLGNSEVIADDALEHLKLMEDDIYFAYTVALVPRLWAHLNMYNDFTLAWHSSGLDKYWEWKIAADYMNAIRQNRIVASTNLNVDIGPVKLGIDNFISIIMLWSFGMICSLPAFIYELMCSSSRI